MIDFFEIKKLFGVYDTKISFNENSPKVKILVGDNGSAKTTIMNLLYAFLSKDFSSIKNIEFESFSLKLINVHSEVTLYKRDLFPAINSMEKIIRSSSLYEDLVDKTRYDERNIFEIIKNRYTDNSVLSNEKSKLLDILIEEYNCLEQLNNLDQEIEFNQIKSKNTNYELERKEFVFNQIKDIPSFNILYLPTYRRLECNISKQQQQEISNILNMPVTFGMSDIKSDFDRITRKITNLWLQEFVLSSNPQELNGINQRDDSRTRKDVLMNKVHNFINVCNKYLKNKEFKYDIEKGIYVELTNKKSKNNILDLDFLSSGEKQLVSLFSKIYLKEIGNSSDRFYIFIDEPETSLSIEWQQNLLNDILESQKCDMLFVLTHSPFIFKKGLIKYTSDVEQYIVKHS